MKSTSFERFAALLRKVQKVAPRTKDDLLRIRAYIQADSRGEIFRIQGMLRIFSGHEEFGAENFKKGYKKARDFEDLLGRYTDSARFEKKVADLKVAGIDAAVEKRVRRDLEALLAFLEDEWPLDQEDKWIKKYKERFGLITGKDEKLFLLSELRAFVEDVRTRKYDLSELQTGVHEYRRKLRWILLILQSEGGFFELVDRPSMDKSFAKYLDGTGVRESAFSKLPILYPEKNPCQLSRSLIEMITLAVFKIGEGKDSGELAENLSHAFQDSGMSRKEADAKGLDIAKAQPNYVDPYVTAKHWKSVLGQEKILELLEQELEACKARI